MSTGSQKYEYGAQQRGEILKKELSFSNMQVAYDDLRKTTQNESVHDLGRKSMGHRNTEWGRISYDVFSSQYPSLKLSAWHMKGEINGQEKMRDKLFGTRYKFSLQFWKMHDHLPDVPRWTCSSASKFEEN